MNNKNLIKTSTNVTIGLANVYGGKGCDMKKAVLAIKPSDLTDSALLNLFKKYGIKIPNGAKNLWHNISYFDELSTLLFPNPSDRNNKKNVKLHLRMEEKEIVLQLSGEKTFTEGFFRLLLLHYAMNQQDNMAQIKENITEYFNSHILRLSKESIHTNSYYDMQPPAKIKTSSDTGLKIHGNKKWFLSYFEEILQSLPNSIDTFVESCMGSGVVTLEAYKQSRFKRIITNDIYWHKVNFLRAFFFNPDALKISCLSLQPNQKTYAEAKAIIEEYKSSSSDKVLPDVAAKYLFINYCNSSRGGLNKKNLIEHNKDAVEKYKKYLDCLWNSYHYAKKVMIHNEDASEIIKKYNRKKHLLFVDPPYPKTKGYETDFSMKDFESIAKATIDFNGCFIFCCRITNKHEKTYSHKNTYAMDDLRIKHIIDHSFYGHNLYYRDYLFDKGGVAIERVITNFPFAGCSHYDTEQTCQGE